MLLRQIWLLLFILGAVLLPASAQTRFNAVPNPESETVMKPDSVSVTQWWTFGPVDFPLPAFHETPARKYQLKDLLESEPLDLSNLWLDTGATSAWFHTQKIPWQTATSADSVTLQPTTPDTTRPQIAYLATYISADRWLKLKLKVSSAQLLKVYWDGEVKATKSKVDKSRANKPAKPDEISADLEVETGKHRLVLKTLYDPAAKSAWTIKATMKIEKPAQLKNLTLDLSPGRIFHVDQLLEGPKLSAAEISPDGHLVALRLSQQLPTEDESESWLELREFETGKLVQTFRGGMRIPDFKWAPTGRKFSYVSSRKEETTLWIVDLNTGTTLPLVRNLKEYNGHTWAPDASYIIYGLTEKPEKDKRGVKQLKGIYDRWAYGRNQSFLYQVTVPEGIKRRLTGGEFATDLMTIHPQAKSLLFTRTIEDLQNRPYEKIELYHFNLENWETKLLWGGYFLNSVRWSPDGAQLLVLAGPATFGALGLNVPTGVAPNDYDTQAYLFDPEMKNGVALTWDFNPSIQQAVWSEFDGQIYFNTIDGAHQQLYRYQPQKRIFQKIATPVEVVNSFNLARTSPRLVFTGSSTLTPPAAYTLKLPGAESRLLLAPDAETFRQIRPGKVETWQFTNQAGTPIDGCIYYPPDFDPAQKYPGIVYYYGGTSPVSRDFGGRYPKNLYAAQGYVVYVLQPSGATGFGQTFSAKHVNDWGQIVAQEIIDGVQKFLAAHPFVDPKRVGCIGASFGGFMTQLLLTRTEMFAAAVSHAGISDLPGYWGEGYWGYTYSAVATANSFPWNRRDIYVEQSPIFSAHKITTPLLLTHGAGDTNVPPGQSDQMYIALKLLGKTVEYLQFDGQNHFIADYKQRKLWTKSIMAWFERWLKDQPQFWEALYPPPADKK